MSEKIQIYETEEYRKRVGERLKALRVGRHYTQEEFAELCHISRAYYGRIERGEYAVTVDKLLNIATAFKLDVYELFVDLPR